MHEVFCGRFYSLDFKIIDNENVSRKWVFMFCDVILLFTSARGILAIPFLREELLKYIEEKEFILAQRQLPTREGSRPYSTPNLT